MSLSGSTRWLALAVMLAAVALAAGSGSFSAAQDERGQGIEFPFRDNDGNLLWIVSANEVEAEARTVFPLDPRRRDSAYHFRTAANRAPDDDGIARGVNFVMPFEDERAGRGGRFERGRRLARLDASAAVFFPAVSLVQLDDVHLRLALDDPNEQQQQRPAWRNRDDAADDDNVDERAELRTSRLYVAFDPSRLRGTEWHVADEPGSDLGARIFTTEWVSLHVPQQHLHIREARGLDLREGDPQGRIRFDGRMRGVMADANWLDLAATPTARLPEQQHQRRRRPANWLDEAESTPGVVQFHCEGACEIFLGERFQGAPQQVTMRRGVMLRQAVEGRELVCDRLFLDLSGSTDADDDESATPGMNSTLREVLAEEQVRLEVAGSLRARGSRFAFRFEPGENGAQRQIGTLDGVESIRLYTEDRDPISATGFDDEVPVVSTLIDGFAEGRVTYLREVYPQRRHDQAGALRGTENWTLHQFARLERWVALGEEIVPEADGRPLVPDFGASRHDPARPTTTAPRQPRTRETNNDDVSRPIEPDRHVRDGYRLVNAINGSGVRRLGGDDEAQLAPSGELIPPRIDPERRGRIDISFRLHEQDGATHLRRGETAEPTREFDFAVIENPGARPIVEVYESGPFGMRFFADRLELERDYDAASNLETMYATFHAERPQITWITPQDRFGLWPLEAPEEAVYRYSLGGRETLHFEETRHLDEATPLTRRLRAPGRVSLRKSPFQGFGTYDERRLVEWDCRDLELDFVARPEVGLELNAMRAQAPHNESMRLKMGLDVLRCSSLEYRRDPIVEPGTWQEVLHLEGPVRLDLRDERSTTLLPIRGADERLLTPALSRIEAEERVWIRTELKRVAGAEPLPQRREIEFVGPFQMRAFADDPERLPADVTPRLLLSMSGEYLDVELVEGEDEDEPGRLAHVRTALAAGEIELDYRSRGIWMAGQRVDYRDGSTAEAQTEIAEPSQDSDDADAHRSRLRLIGAPTLRIRPTGRDAPAGHFTVTFPETQQAAVRARQRIELLGEPWHIRVLPRATLTWQPAESEDGAATEALRLTANHIDGRLHPLTATNEVRLDEPTESQTIARLFAGGGGITLTQLSGTGHVHLRTGTREALGEMFMWRRHDGQFAYLWGFDAVVRERSETGLSFELRAEQERERRRTTTTTGEPRVWQPGAQDPAAPALQGTTFRYRDRDPTRPERRDIIEGTNPNQRLRLTLELPEAIRRTAQDILPSPEARTAEDDEDDEVEQQLPEPTPYDGDDDQRDFEDDFDN